MKKLKNTLLKLLLKLLLILVSFIVVTFVVYFLKFYDTVKRDQHLYGCGIGPKQRKKESHGTL